MEKTIFFVLLLFSTANGFTQPLLTNETKYVWARSGLNLRKTPDFKGEKLTTLPYGAKVTLTEYPLVERGTNDIGEYEYPQTVTVTALKWPGQNDPEMSYKVSGSWAKVRANNQEGYLFTGYLSTMPPYFPATTPNLTKTPLVSEGFVLLKDYITQTYGVMKTDSQFVIYGNGSYESKNMEIASDRWVFPALSPEDGYLLANFCFALEKKCEGPKGEEGFEFGGASQKGINFYFDNEGANFEFRITFSEGVVVLISEWGGD